MFLHVTAAGKEKNRLWTSELVGYKIIIHELGHYGLFLYDEYCDAEYDMYPEYKTDVTIGPKGFMNSEFEFSEMTTPDDYTEFLEYLDIYNDKHLTDYSDTHQHADEHDMDGSTITNPNAGESCWETVFRKFNSCNGEYIKWIEFDLDPNNEEEEYYYPDYVADDGQSWDSDYRVGNDMNI